LVAVYLPGDCDGLYKDAVRALVRGGVVVRSSYFWSLVGGYVGFFRVREGK
jgi:hypothetical protein